MKQNSPLIFMILSVLAVAGCAPATPSTEENVPTHQAAPAEPYHPLTTQTNIQTIDQVLRAVGDPEALRALIEYTSAVCTHQDGLGGPPKCREGEAEGTPVAVLAFLGSGGDVKNRGSTAT
jgi:hypothetical protein